MASDKLFELDKCCVAHLPRKYIHGWCGLAVTWTEIVYKNEFELIC